MDRIIEPRELEPVAFQEAGQAVMAYFEGVPGAPVQLRPAMAAADAPSGLYVAHWPDWADPWSEKFRQRPGREWFEKRMVVTFAGLIAERRHGNQGDSGSEIDWEQAQRAAFGFWSGEQVTIAWLRWLYIRAEAAFEEPEAWHTVEAVAVELLNCRTVNGRVLAVDLIRETYRQQFPYLDDPMWPMRTDVTDDATGTVPVMNEGCSPAMDVVARRIDGALPERQEQRRREQAMGVLSIDALRRKPGIDNR